MEEALILLVLIAFMVTVPDTSSGLAISFARVP